MRKNAIRVYTTIPISRCRALPATLRPTDLTAILINFGRFSNGHRGRFSTTTSVSFDETLVYSKWGGVVVSLINKDIMFNLFHYESETELGNVYPSNYGNRAYGLSIRCLQE